MSRNSKIDDSFPKTQSPGSLHLEYKRCGKAACHCNDGFLHGPYIYRRWREHGRQRRQYIPMPKLASTLMAVEQERTERDTIAALKEEQCNVG